VAWVTLEEKLRQLSARCAAAERRAQNAEEYAERTCRIYHGMYEKHRDRIAAIERRLAELD